MFLVFWDQQDHVALQTFCRDLNPQGLRCFADVASLALVGHVANDVRKHFHLNYLVISQESKKHREFYALASQKSEIRDRIFGSLLERMQNSKAGLLGLRTFCNQETTSVMFEALLTLAALPSRGLTVVVAMALVLVAKAFQSGSWSIHDSIYES